MVAGSHCYTGRLVPKAGDHLDKKEGATLLTADCGGSSTMLLWLLFAMLSIEGGWPASPNRTETNVFSINALNTSIEFSQRHDVIEHHSRSSFGSVSGRLNRTVAPLGHPHGEGKQSEGRPGQTITWVGNPQRPAFKRGQAGTRPNRVRIRGQVRWSFGGIRLGGETSGRRLGRRQTASGRTPHLG